MKIFATVGTQLPFNRLIRELDDWAGSNPEVEVFAQVGRSSYQPRHMSWEKMIPAARFESLVEECNTIVAHAGMGTIISGIEYGKRVIVMPRREEYGEHRNNHQLATADRFARIFNLEVVHTPDELFSSLDVATDASGLTPIDLCASPQLISEIRQFAGLESS
jgi:UDP-N-acetylglucosamine transferase subunit ALG13